MFSKRTVPKPKDGEPHIVGRLLKRRKTFPDFTNLLFDDARILKIHAEVHWQQGQWCIRDPGLKFGTFLNQTLVGAEPLALSPGDFVGFLYRSAVEKLDRENFKWEEGLEERISYWFEVKKTAEYFVLDSVDSPNFPKNVPPPQHLPKATPQKQASKDKADVSINTTNTQLLITGSTKLSSSTPTPKPSEEKEKLEREVKQDLTKNTPDSIVIEDDSDDDDDDDGADEVDFELDIPDAVTNQYAVDTSNDSVFSKQDHDLTVIGNSLDLRLVQKEEFVVEEVGPTDGGLLAASGGDDNSYELNDESEDSFDQLLRDSYGRKSASVEILSDHDVGLTKLVSPYSDASSIDDLDFVVASTNYDNHLAENLLDSLVDSLDNLFSDNDEVADLRADIAAQKWCICSASSYPSLQSSAPSLPPPTPQLKLLAGTKRGRDSEEDDEDDDEADHHQRVKRPTLSKKSSLLRRVASEAVRGATYSLVTILALAYLGSPQELG
ncbi:FHA domain-containing protein [Kocuria palustris]|nr:FHA domain-containing protein [Kocuria palustris]